VLVRPGDRVRVGDPLFEVACDSPGRMVRGVESLAGAVELGEAVPDPRPLVADRVTAG
jgi:thymidine phosphorylase